MRSVVVIGAGVGGIAAAAELAQHGYRVTVLEKNGTAGGRCGRAELDGHRFDTGATLLLMPEFYAAAFRALGKQMEDYLELTRVDPTYHIHFADGSDLILTSDRARMRQQLEAIEPGSFAGLLRYLDEGARNYRLAVPRFMTHEYGSLAEFLSPPNLLALARVNALRHHYDNVGRYFKDDRLRAAFTFQSLYLGLSPYVAPATYSLLQYAEFADGVWYPRGGLFRVVEALVAIAEEAGVRFVYDAPVERIEVQGDRATGVTLIDGTQTKADVVVANADLGYVYRSLLPFDRQAKRIERKRQGCSALTFHWGLDRRCSQLSTHNLFVGHDIRGAYSALFDGSGPPEDPHFYLHAPSTMDPSVAPPGGDSLSVVVPSPHLERGQNQDWDGARARARRAIFRRLEAIGLGSIQDHIKFEISRTPVDWEDQYNLVNGSTHGLSHELSQMSYLRPHNRHARFRNLYFVGASTHPGTGIPNVLLSARFAARRIALDHVPAGCAARYGRPRLTVLPWSRPAWGRGPTEVGS